MKKTLSTLCALALLLSCCAFAPSARAADDTFRVRVNGYLVDFPDAQPFCDENQRTLAPIRFVTEQLGADVSWRQADQTAVITKDGTTVEITIGSPTLHVIKGGKTTTVTMDTAAVGKDGRTYVPIRYVAEQLGAYVDWSQRHRVVGVYQGELTPEQIAELQKLDMTFDSYGYDWTSKSCKKNDGSWADMREDLYAQRRTRTINYRDMGQTITVANSEEYYANIIKDAKAAIEYHSDNLDVTFAADPSCIYQQADSSVSAGSIYVSVRGVVTVTEKAHINNMTGGERYLLINVLQRGMAPTLGEPYTFPIDGHFCNGGTVDLHEVARLDNPTYATIP